MKNKSILILLPIFLFVFNAEAAIFLPKTTQLQEQTSIGSNEIIKEGQKKENKVFDCFDISITHISSL